MSRARPYEPPAPAAWVSRTLARTPPEVYLAVVLPVVVAIAATALQPWLPPSDLLRDSQVVAAAHAGSSPAYGLLSNVGIVVLALSGGAACIARLILRGAPAPQPQLLTWTAVLSMVLVLDDLLLLHEAAAFALGAGALVAAGYGLAFLCFVVRFRDVILRDLDAGLLLLAVGALGVSVVTDLLVAPTQSSVVVEDGAKLLGLVAWSAFVLRASFSALWHRRTADPGAAAGAGAAADAGAGARTTRAAGRENSSEVRHEVRQGPRTLGIEHAVHRGPIGGEDPIVDDISG